MELFLAIDIETNDSKIFTNYEDLKGFAVEKRYAYDYFKLGVFEEIPDVDLFYYS